MTAPDALLALVVLVVNDHWAKAVFDSYLTGKLSDFSGLYFFPILLVGLVERLLLKKVASKGWVWGAGLATALVFALMKTWAPMGMLYAYGLGLIQWPWHFLVGAAPFRPVRMVMDASDLMALPMCALAIGRGVWRLRTPAGPAARGG